MPKIKGLIIFPLILLLCLAPLALTGCGQQGDAGKSGKTPANTLVVGAENEPERLNPIMEETMEMEPMIFRGLTRFDENNKPVADLAKSWEIAADGLSYIFHLRDDVKWHDGKPFTAKDVKFTLEAIMNPQNNSPNLQELEEVKTVEVIDDHTVKITLKRTFPPLLDKLTRGMVPEHILAGQDIATADFNNNPIGTGPFKFVEWKKGQNIVLEANKDYYGTKPKLEKVIFKVLPDANVRAVQLETGEVDVTFLEPDQLKRMEKVSAITVHKIPTADYRVMMFNFRKPLWQDVKVRQAICYATNRQAILDGVLLGEGSTAYGPLQLNWANNPNVEKYDYNVDKAKALLAEAGWKPGKDGILEKNGQKLSFKLTTFSHDPVRVNIVNALSAELKKIGIDCIPDPRERGSFKWNEVESFLLGWGSPFDPDDHAYKLFHSSQIENGWNLQGYKNAQVDKYLELARTTADEGKRKEYYAKFQEELAKDPSFDFIVYLKALYGVNKNVEGVKERILGHHGAGFLWNVEEWSKK